MKNPKFSVKWMLVAAVVSLGVFTNTHAQQPVVSQSPVPFIMNGVDVSTHLTQLFGGWREELESYPFLDLYPNIFQRGGNLPLYVVDDSVFRISKEKLYHALLHAGFDPNQISTFSPQLIPSNRAILVEVNFDGSEVTAQVRSQDPSNGNVPSVSKPSDSVVTTVVTPDNRISNPPKSARLEITQVGKTTKGTIAVIIEQAEDRGDLLGYEVVVAHELGETPILDQFFDIPSEFAADDEHAIPLPSDVTIPLDGLFLQTTITAVLASNSRESVPYFFETKSPDIVSPSTPTGLRIESVEESIGGEKRFTLSFFWKLPPNSYGDPSSVKVIIETKPTGETTSVIVIRLSSDDMPFLTELPSLFTTLQEQQTTLTVVVYDTTLNNASSSTTRMIVDTTSLPPSTSVSATPTGIKETTTAASVSAILIPIEGTTTASVEIEIVHPVEGTGDIVTYYVTVSHSQPSTNTWMGEYTLTEADRQSDRVTWLIPTNELTVDLNGETIMIEVTFRNGNKYMSVDATATTVVTPSTTPSNP